MGLAFNLNATGVSLLIGSLIDGNRIWKERKEIGTGKTGERK